MIFKRCFADLEECCKAKGVTPSCIGFCNKQFQENYRKNLTEELQAGYDGFCGQAGHFDQILDCHKCKFEVKDGKMIVTSCP